MPYTSVEPKEIVNYRGVRVFYTYKNNIMTEPAEFCYTCDLSSNEVQFDVRDLLVLPGIDHSQHEQIIMSAIDHGGLNNYLTSPPESFRWPFSWRTLPRHLLQRLFSEYESYQLDHAGAEPWEIDRFYKGTFQTYALSPVIYFCQDVYITQQHVVEAVEEWLDLAEASEHPISSLIQFNQYELTVVLQEYAASLGQQGLVLPSTVLDQIDQDDIDVFSERICMKKVA